MNDSQEVCQKVSDEEKQKIMREIEAKTENILIAGMKSGKITNPITAITQNMSKEQAKQSLDLLQAIMGSGAAEFEKKVGRPMTYSEMRNMYG